MEGKEVKAMSLAVSRLRIDVEHRVFHMEMPDLYNLAVWLNIEGTEADLEKLRWFLQQFVWTDDEGVADWYVRRAPSYGPACPGCGDPRNWERGEITFIVSDGVARSKLECHTCESTWEEVYELSRIAHVNVQTGDTVYQRQKRR